MEEDTYKVTIHLINGKKLKVYGGQTVATLDKLYSLLGDKTARLKFPTDHKTWQLIPVTSVLRIEAFGFFN